MRSRDGTIRTATGAGRWFSADPSSLKNEVRSYIDTPEVPKTDGRIASAIAPHAGYAYSGAVAGHTFRAIRDNDRDTARTVVILGVSHRASFPGLALMDGTAIETPLGQTLLDQSTGQAFVNASPAISFSYGPHHDEHSAENQIPFVQTALPASKLILGLFGDHTDKTIEQVVHALISVAEQTDILVLASTDMLHNASYDLVSDTDRLTLSRIASMDHEAILRDWSPNRQTFCGIGPVIAAMRFAEEQGSTQGAVLCYRNSADDHPDSRGDWVVGYGAAVFAIPV